MAVELQYPSVDHIKTVTTLKDNLVIQGCLETLKWLDQSAPEQFDGLKGTYAFDIREVVSPGIYNHDLHHHCGTTCCIGGAINLYRAKGDPWKASNLGLSSLEEMDRQLSDLFYPGGRKKPTTAAKVLRHYLFTGVVNWDVKAGKRYNVEA